MKSQSQWILIVLTLFLLSFSSCKKEKQQQRDPLLMNMNSLSETPNQNPVPSGDSSQDQIKKRIQGYEGELKKVDKDVAKLANKMISKVSKRRQLFQHLGDRYLELGWFKQSYQNYKKALEIQPDEETIHYKAAVAAGSYAMAIAPEIDDELTLEKAEYHYKQALGYRADYKEALCGLAILYHFEWGQPVKAFKLVDKAFNSGGRITPQMLLLRVSLFRYFGVYKLTNGVNYPGVGELYRKISSNRREAGKPVVGWYELAIDDCASLVAQYGNSPLAEVQQKVKQAKKIRKVLSRGGDDEN